MDREKVLEKIEDLEVKNVLRNLKQQIKPVEHPKFKGDNTRIVKQKLQEISRNNP